MNPSIAARRPTVIDHAREVPPADFYAATLQRLRAPNDDGWASSLCPFHDDHSPSFSVNLTTGAFACHACPAKGGGLLDFIMARDGCDVLTAARTLTGEAEAQPLRRSNGKTHKPRQPRRVFAKNPKQAAHTFAKRWLGKGYQATGLHCYETADGTPIFWRIRAKHPDGRKWISPFHATGRSTADGIAEGIEYELAEPKVRAGGKPLYRLPDLVKRPAETVWVVEGESCADELHKLCMVATTSGGSSSAKGADWSPLQGRHCVIWPDNDSQGEHYASDVCAALKAAGASDVHLVDVDALGLSDKGDCVDWLKTHPRATAAEVRALATLAAPEPQAREGLLTRCLADIAPEEIHWLWPGRIALGKLTVIAGDPGLGKSLVTLAIAAAVSKGATWPVDGGTAPVGDVLLLSAEDDPADTIRPRLDAAGADVRRVHVVEAVKRTASDGTEHEGTFNLADDLAALKTKLATLPGCKLIVIDPLSAYLGGTDSHRNAEMRGLLKPLADLARRCRVAVVNVEHLNKSSGRSAIYRVQGSIATVGAARAVHAVTKDRDDPRRRLMLPAKNNLARDDLGGLAYRVGTASNGAPVVEWEPEPVTVTAEDALNSEPDEVRTARDDASEWLGEELKAGPVQTKELQQCARDAGHSWPTVKRAKARLRVVSEKAGFPGVWRWSLPTKGITKPEGDQAKHVIPFGKCDPLRSENDPADPPADLHDEAEINWTEAV